MFTEIEYMNQSKGKIEGIGISDRYITCLSKWTSSYIKKTEYNLIKKYSAILYWCICNSEIGMLPTELRNSILEKASADLGIEFNEIFNLYISYDKYFYNYNETDYKVIAIEGIDGTGKTVQTDLLNKKLIELGYKTKIFEFPNYSSFFGKTIGEFLSGKMHINANIIDSKSMSLWYALDRKRSIDDEDLNKFDYVILNRYTLSNAVYQGIRSGDETGEIVNWIFNLEHKELKLPIPDIYIVLDLNVGQSQSNVDVKGKRDYIEEKDVYEQSKDLLQNAREKYKHFSEVYPNILMIECSDDDVMRPIDDINNQIIESLRNAEIIL